MRFRDQGNLWQRCFDTRRSTALVALRLEEYDFEDFAVPADVHTASARPPPIARLRRAALKLESGCKSLIALSTSALFRLQQVSPLHSANVA